MGILSNILGDKIGTFLTIAYSVALLLPGLGICVRRLHDIGKSGLYYFMVFIPLVGPIILLIYFIKKGDPESNQYGENPENLY